MANLTPSPARSRWQRNKFAFSWAFAGVALLLVLVRFNPFPATRPLVSHQVPAPAPAQITVATHGPDLIALSTKLDEPLEAELHLAINDARTALTSLSHNLFPEELLTSLR